MNKQEIKEMLQHAEQKVVYSFITTYAEANAEFCEQLKVALMPKKEKYLSKEMYLAKAEMCFDFEEEGGWQSRDINFYQAAYKASARLNKMLSDANCFIEQKAYAPAVGIIMSVIEVIPANYGEVDDSSGSVGGVFNTATHFFIDMLRDKQVPEKWKKEIYRWVKQEMTNSIYSDYGFDSLAEVYEAACEEVGETNEVLANLDNQIEAAKDHQKEYVVLRKIRFMQSRNLDTQAFIEKHFEMNEVRQMRFDQLMKSELYEEALVLAEKGKEIAKTQRHWGAVSNWEKSILEIYQKQGDVKNILLQAEKLLSESRDNSQKYYEILKKHTSPKDWKDTVKRILDSLEGSSFFNSFAADVMVEHQMWKRLFAYCKKGDSIVTKIEKYESYLKPHFGKKILDIYHEYVEEQALSTYAYDSVAYMLKRMRTVEGGDVLVDQLLEKYRNIYKRRKNMMAALKNV